MSNQINYLDTTLNTTNLNVNGTTTLKGDILPDPTNLRNIGSSSLYFNTINVSKMITKTTGRISIGDDVGNNQGGSSIAIGNLSGTTYQGANSIAIGNQSGTLTQGSGSISIGNLSGTTNQGSNSVSIGNSSGSLNQGTNSISIGYFSGYTAQGAGSIAIGYSSGSTNQGNNSVSIGYQAGLITQGAGSVAIGYLSGSTNQGINSISIGYSSGQNTQGTNSVSIGNLASQYSQGSASISIGNSSGQYSQGNNSVSIGNLASQYSQGAGSISIGNSSGQYTQGINSVAIGNQSGLSGQGNYAISIGYQAGYTGQHNNSIILNASGSVLNSDNTSRFYVNPIRSGGTGGILLYNSTSEITSGGDASMTSLTINTTNTSTISQNISSTSETYDGATSSSKNSNVTKGTNVMISNVSGTSNSGTLIDMGAYNNTLGTNIYFGAVSGQTANSAANFVIGRRTGATSWAESMRINTLGQVGIGTSTPSTILDINGVTTVRGNILSSTTNAYSLGTNTVRFQTGFFKNTSHKNGNGAGTNTYSQILLNWEPDAGSNYAHSIRTRHAQSNNAENAIDFYLWQVGNNIDSVGDKHMMSITSNGVGIGTTLASTKLHLVGTQSGISNSVHNDFEYGNYDGGTYGKYVTFGTDNPSYNSGSLSVYKNGVEAIRLGGNGNSYFNAGNVGIGTTTPSTILDVNGVTTVRGNILPEASGTRNIGSSSAYFNSINVNNIVTNTTGRISIGDNVGINNQGTSSIAIGNLSGTTYQGNNSIAIGNQSGSSTQGAGSISIGNFSGSSGQGTNSISIGNSSGSLTQGINSVAIGYQAGFSSQGNNSIAIGNQAGQTNQPSQSIILNANNIGFSTATQSNALYINPIRKDNSSITQNQTYYNPNTKELTYADSSITNYNQVTLSQNVSGETLKKSITQYNFRKTSIKNSSIDFTIDNYIDNAQEYTFGRSSQNIWVAVGSGTHTLAYSTNGKNWIGLGAIIFTTKGNGVSWNGNMWVAVGSGTNTIAYSYNGLSWFPAYNSLNIFNFEGLCVTWNGNMWIAGGAGTLNSMAYSYDGINWTGLGFIFQNYCKRIEFNGTTLCAVGGGISRATFTGGNQILGTLKSTQIFKAICCSASGQYQYAVNFLGGGTSTQLYRSTDFGNTWASSGSATGGTGSMNQISCSRNGQYVYFGLANASSASVVISSDYGVTLSTKSITSGVSYTGLWTSCSGDGSIVYAIGEAFYSKSVDFGNTWSTASSTILVSGVSTSLQNLLRTISCSLDGKYVLIGRSSTSYGAVFISSDYGVNWITSQNSLFINTDTRASCMSPSGQYILVSPLTSGSSYISRDYGNSWFATSPTIYGVSACCSDDFKFILCGTNTGAKKLYYSSNYGVNFTDVTDSPVISGGYDSICCSSDFSYIQYATNGSIYSRDLFSIFVTSVSSGLIQPGLLLSGTGISSNTRITSFNSGSGLNGSIGNYRVNTYGYFSSTTISGISTSIAYSTDGLNWTNNSTNILSNQGNGVGWNGNMWLTSGIGSSVFSASIGNTIQPMLSISSVSYGSVYPGLNISGGTIFPNTFISQGNVTFTGSISGTILTVTSTLGVISSNMIISGSGIITGTSIISGSGLSWTVSISQTVSSTTITGIHQGTGTSGTYYLNTTQNISSSAFTTGGTASITSGTVSGTTLTVTNLTGLISIGMVLTGANIVPNTYVTSFNSGTNGGVGTYTVSQNNATPSTGTITGTLTTTFLGSISSGTNILTVNSNPTTGIIYLGMVLSNNLAVNGLYISGYGTGTGGSGTYILSGNASGTISSVSLNGNFNSSSFTASISGSTLNVSALASGTIYPGSILSSGNCLGSTYITSQISGTTGGVGNYGVNVLQNVSSQTITATGLASASNTMGYSNDAITWTSLSPNIFTEGYGISWNGKMWVVGGTGNTSSLIYSYDGLYWFGLGTNIFSKCYNLFWNGCKWIAGGESTNKLAFANIDGTNWKAISAPFTNNCLDIAYNFKKENKINIPKRLNIMLGTQTYNMKYSYSDPSSNLISMSWSNMPNSSFVGLFNSVRSADHNGNIFVAGGDGSNTLAYSYDGLNWVGIGNTIFSTVCNFVKFNGKMWLAGGQGLSASFIGRIDNGIIGNSGTILTVISNLSGNLVVGMTITGSTIAANTTITAILSPNTYTVSSSQNISSTLISANTSTGVIAYSYDGLTWLNSSTTFFTQSAQWVDWNGNIWVIVGVGTNTIGYSYDGLNWFSVDKGNILTNPFTIKWNGKLWVAGGSQICYSNDGIIWYSVTSPFSAYCYSIDWNENLWVAGGWGGTSPIAYSTDAINWVSVSSPALGSRCYGVFWNGSYWLAGGSGTNSYAHSLDGINWSVGANIFNSQGYSATSTKKIGLPYIQQPLVALGSGANHTLSYSSNDGLTFNGLGKNIFPLKSNTTCWNGKLWVAGGVSNSSSFLASITNNTTLTVSEILYDYPTLNPNVSSWGTSSFLTFTQDTTANQPTFDGTSVNFSGGLKSSSTAPFLFNNNLTFNSDTNGGFTAIAYVKFSALQTNGYERIFDFGSGSPSNNISLCRFSTNSFFSFFFYTSTTKTLEISGGQINIGQWSTISIVYTKGNAIPFKMYQNKLQLTTSIQTGNNISTTIMPNQTSLNSNLIGKSNWSTFDDYFNGSIGGLLVYDRALSDTELNNATDALVNKTLNFSTTNLKVRLLALPNTGKIYQGMTLSGSGVTSNTKIIGGPTTGATGTYTISSSNNVSSNTIISGSSSSLAYSYDAINWNPLGNSIFSNVCNNITWTGSQFVAVGEGLVSFIGSISGTILTVSSVLSGTIYVGMTIYNSSVTSNTKISSFISGIGSVGTYTVSNSQNVSSQFMNGTPITVAYSPDGINWTPTQNQIASGADSVIYDGKKSVVVATGFSSFIGRIDNGSGSSGNILTVSEILYDYPIANPRVNRWNTFSQYTTANQPTFDGTSVNFARANSQYLSNNNLTLNINSNGGFTAIIYIKFTGTPISGERFFDFSSVVGISSTGNSVQLYRPNGTQNVNFSISKNNSGYVNVISSGNETITNEWAVFSCRYTKIGTTTSPAQIYKNKNLIASGFSTADPIDFTTTYNFIGRDTYVTSAYTNASIGGLLVYDRSLSDTELNNATDALVNKTLNFSTTNLKVRLLIMNPNPSLIYTGMTLSGGGVNDGTIISSYGSGSGGVGTYNITSSGSVSSWNTFSQATSANQPTFDLYSVNFNRTNSQFLLNSSLSYNIQTNSGFTAIAYVNFSGTVGSFGYDRIFEFTNGSGGPNDSILVARSFTSANFFASVYNSTTPLINIITTGSEITQNVWMSVSLRYSYSGGLGTLQLYKNKTLIGSGTNATQLTNKSLIYNFIGKSNAPAGNDYFNGSIRGLLFYDRALSDTELNTATDALVNGNSNFSKTNLVVNLAISDFIPFVPQLVNSSLINASNVNLSSSTDLITWTSPSNTNLSALALNGIAYNGVRYVSVGGGVISFQGRIDNGTVGNSGTTLTVSAIYAGSIYIGMTLFSSGMTNCIVTSYLTGSGGIGTYTTTISQNITSRMMFGSPLTMSYSSDLSTWTPVTNSSFSNQGNCVSWNGQMWVSVGDGTSDILYSQDGISWLAVQNANTLLSPNPVCVNWTGKKWIAGGPVLTSSFTGSISGMSLTVSSFTNSPLVYVGMLISGTGVAPGTKIVSGTSSPYTVNISQNVSSTTLTGTTNSSVYSYDGINWSDMGVNNLINTQCNGVIGNPRVGTVVVDSQIVLDNYGSGLSDSFELVSDKFYNNDFNSFSASIFSNQI